MGDRDGDKISAVYCEHSHGECECLMDESQKRKVLRDS
jgi:hypothetical protein